MTLWESIDGMAGEPWKWGQFDCLHFCARVLRDMTGVDYRKQLPTYTHYEQAEEHMESLGDVPAIITRVLGEPKPVLQARKGDVVVADLGQGLAAGICTGQKAAFASFRGGVFFIDMNHCVSAWNGR